MSRDMRSTYPLCGAKRRNGEPCRLFAGQSTDHLGIGKCFLHGGRSPNHMKHAAKVEAERRMAKLGEAVDIAPAEALLATLRLSAGHLAYLRSELAEGRSGSPYEEGVLLAMYGSELDRVARIARSCLDAGITQP